MSESEVAAFLDEQRIVVCATNGTRGWPHLMPLWYIVRDGEIWAWTYAKSQKVRNLERDARATLQLEDGERFEEAVRAQAAKRVALQFVPSRVASWDHGKLGGVY